MEILIKAAQLIMSLSILVVLHELGHFIPAKLFKTRVEKFYLFFDPWFSLFKFKKGETEYGVGWLPLGGYVKISGMIDESMDTEQMAQPAQPWEFRSKPAWQRLIIMLGGVTVNLILGFVIFTMILFYYGKDSLPVDEVKWGIACDSLLQDIGFQNGDRILALNGQTPESFNDVRLSLLLDDIQTVSVERLGQRLDIQLPPDFGQMMVDSGLKQPMVARFPTIVDSVMAGSPAAACGLLKGDSIVGVDNMSSIFLSDIQPYLQRHKGEEVDIHVVRNDMPLTLTCSVSQEGTVGFYRDLSIKRFFKVNHEEFSLAQSIPAGYHHAMNELTNYIVQMKFLFSKAGASQIGGFGTIGGLFSATWDWEVFWERTAWLSLVLAFMNVLPIPALDGGHVMFLLYEMIAGKAPNQKFLEKAQMIGIILLLGLLLYANGNDLFRSIMG
ncbi:MAG: RIP metalloprotease RseP [Flavobacteriales bacterium]|nr:RIP metalloprotease RseP [Flavobacteriales bacterium]